jgi:hypothetical protein
MKKQKSSLWERLKICWYVLTKKYYVYFGLDKEPIIWNEDNTYLTLKKKSVKAYSYITYDYKFDTKNGESNLHDFIWECIGKISKEAQEGKF